MGSPCPLPLLLVAAVLLMPSTDAGMSRSFFVNTRAFSPSQIEDTTNALISLAKVVCDDSSVGVVFRREDMINLGIGPNQLTLSDENCVATTNATHYLLLTEPTGCQSNISNTSSPSSVDVSNSVQVNPPPNISLRSAALSSSQDEPLQPSGRLRGQKIVLDFSCRYLDKESDGSGKRILPNDIHIDFFSTDAFTSILDPDKNAPTKGTSIYVKIGFSNASASPGSTSKGPANVFIHSCFLSNAIDQHSEPAFLINDGCPAQRDVLLKQDSSPFIDGRRFLFRARRPYKSQYMRLTCSLVPCYGSECTSQQDYCDGSRAPNLGDDFPVSYQKIFRVSKRTHQLTEGYITTPTTTTIPATSEPLRLPVSTVVCPRVVSSPTPPQPCQCAPDSLDQQISTISDRTQVTVSLKLTIVVAAGMFCLGAGLIGVLWCIYVRTDPKHKMQPVAISEDGISSSQESGCQTAKLVGASETGTYSIQS